MRLFTGIAIPHTVTGRIEAAVAFLRPAAAVRWSPMTNLHITTKFIGAWPEERLDQLKDELKRALKAAGGPGNLEISVSGFGFFPNPHRPKVVFAGVRAPGIELLYAAVEDALEPLGCARENRAFSPHLTLAKIGAKMGRDDMRRLRDRIESIENSDFGSFTASEFHLYLSRPGPDASIYTSLASFQLTGARHRDDAPSGNHEAITC